MAIIGNFTRAKDGGWEGAIRTLSFASKVRFVPNDNRANDGAPHFHVLGGGSELGVAWVRRKTYDAMEYLSVRLDDPALPQPVKAALFYSDAADTAQLVWNRYNGGSNAS